MIFLSHINQRGFGFNGVMRSLAREVIPLAKLGSKVALNALVPKEIAEVGEKIISAIPDNIPEISKKEDENIKKKEKKEKKSKAMHSVAKPKKRSAKSDLENTIFKNGKKSRKA